MSGRTVGIFMAGLALAVSASAQAPPAPWFNTSAFVGLVSMPSRPEGAAVLDYDEFEKRNGDALRLTTCQQVDAVDRNDIKESQWNLFQLLATNCLAVQKFTRSKPARRSFLKKRIDVETVLKLPAVAIPEFSASEPRGLQDGRSLRDVLKIEGTTMNADRSVRLETDADTLTYRVMARADFDDDGIEDLLIRVDWSAKGGRGKQFDLLVISKTSAVAPMTIAWRPGPLKTGK